MVVSQSANPSGGAQSVRHLKPTTGECFVTSRRIKTRNIALQIRGDLSVTTIKRK
jgi:hypothetical protein